MLAGVFSETNMCNNGESTITIEASYQLENDKDEYYLCNFTTKKLYVYYDLDGGYFKNDEEQVELFNEGHALNLKNGNNVEKDKTSNTTYKFKEWRTERGCKGNKVTSINNTENNIIYACYKEETRNPEIKNVILNKILHDNDIITKKVDTSKIAVSTEFKNTLSSADKNKVTDKENGLFIDMDNDGATFYFRGAVENNYFQYGTYKSTDKLLLWRILRVNGDGTIRLILNDTMDYYLLDYNGNKVSRDFDTYVVKRIFPINHTYSMKTDVYIPRVSTTSGTILKRTIGSTSIDYSLDNYSYNIYPDLQLPFNYGDGDVSNSVGYSDGYVYYKIMNNWANKIVNLPTSNLVNGKFCVTGRAAYYNDNTRYYPNLDFKCDDNVTMNVSKKWSKFGNNTIANSYFGYISYSELLMAGFSSSNTFADSDTFINNKENYITGTITANYSDNTTGGDTYDTYYVASNGGIITERTEQYRKTECSGCIDSVEDSSGNTIYGVNRGKSRSLKLFKVRPVINLSANIKINGTGTKEDPYTLTN